MRTSGDRKRPCVDDQTAERLRRRFPHMRLCDSIRHVIYFCDRLLEGHLAVLEGMAKEHEGRGDVGVAAEMRACAGAIRRGLWGLDQA